MCVSKCNVISITVCFCLKRGKTLKKLREIKVIWFERILANHRTLEDSSSIANLHEYFLNKENFEVLFYINVVIGTPKYCIHKYFLFNFIQKHAE